MLFYIYSDSTSSTIDITSRCRVGRLSVKDQAEEGAVALSTLIVDDPDGDLEITGHRRMYIYESDAPAFDQVIFNGFVVNERVERGPYRTGAGRQWVVDLADPNVFINRRIMNGADADRPAETDTERILALMGMTELNTVDDDSFINLTATETDMDAADYRGQNVGAYIDDCRQASGKNGYIRYNETLGQYGLWYDFPDSTAYDSGMFLSNILSDVNQTTVFEYSQERTYLNRDPSRVASGIYLDYDGGTVYVQNALTLAAFAAIDWAAPSVNVKTLTKATARANRYLDDATTEHDIIHTVVVMPRAKVNVIKKGQLVSFRAIHLPGFESYVVCRVLYRTVTEISEDPQASFEIEMDLDPISPTPVEQFTDNANEQNHALWTWPLGEPGVGNLMLSMVATRGSPGSLTTASVPAAFETTGTTATQVAGTEWDNEDAFDVWPGQGGGLGLASKIGEADDTLYGKWINASGIGRPHVYAIEIAGLAVPSVLATAADQSTGATTYTSPSIIVGASGYIFGCFLYATSGPHDRFGWGGFTMAATAPAVTLGSGWMQEAFGGYSWFGYKYVTAGTYTITLTRTGDAFDPGDRYGWIMAFCVGPVSASFPAG